MLNKYAKRLLKDTIVELENYPKSYHPTQIKLVGRSKSVPYRVIGPISVKILEVAGLDVYQLLKAVPKSYRIDLVNYISANLIFGFNGILEIEDLSDPFHWPDGIKKNDPVGRIKHFLKTNGRE